MFDQLYIVILYFFYFYVLITKKLPTAMPGMKTYYDVIIKSFSRMHLVLTIN